MASISYGLLKPAQRVETLGLELLLPSNVERREEVVVIRVVRRRLKNTRVTEPAEEGPECNLEFAVCEPVDMSVGYLREKKGDKGLRRVLVAYLHTSYSRVRMEPYDVPTSERPQDLASVRDRISSARGRCQGCDA
jgi:hypothetical protein